MDNKIDFSCKFNKDGTIECTFNYYSAYTLNTDVIGIHNGWIIKADISMDSFEWVNYFEAKHRSGEWVYGDFEKTIKASSMKGLGMFLDCFKPDLWDYDDI